ncbi:MAG: nickel pincer cofactor biosynthesis protein LarB [Kiritimatiellae bacterium]|nr:nickel pincer cofactor biosynthesis protein LarB [Kiritimatiellia bacterium]
MRTKGTTRGRSTASRLEADLGFAKLDLDRQRRRGLAEVIYGAGKSAAQIGALVRALNAAGQNACVTRVAPAVYEDLRASLPRAVYHAEARILAHDIKPLPRRRGRVAVVCAGTLDIPVAEEAAIIAERMGARVARIYDVGVAGLHRLLNRSGELRAARALVVVAGMEGALPSVVAGLVERPVIAVPTSVGYGANLGGITALLAMLTSCASGVTVVNIDNGFGAGVAAAMINR